MSPPCQIRLGPVTTAFGTTILTVKIVVPRPGDGLRHKVGGMALHRGTVPRPAVDNPSSNAMVTEANPALGERLEVPKNRLADGPVPADVAYQLIHDELLIDGSARLNLATFVTTWMEPQARRPDGRMRRQEHDRQGRVPADGRAGTPLRRDPGRPVERAVGRGRDRLLDHRLQRSLHVGRHGPAAPVVDPGERPDPAAQPGDGRQRAGLLGEVLPVLGRRAADRADERRPVPPRRRARRRAVRRGHHRRGGHPRLDVRRQLRAGRRDRRRARRARGRRRSRRAGARGRRVRRHDRAVPGSRAGVGLPAAAGGLDQHVRPQVRPGLSRRGLGVVARLRVPAEGADLQRQLPGRQHADVRVELLATRRRGHRAVLHVLPARPGRLHRRPAGLARRRHVPVRPGRGDAAVPAAVGRRPVAGLRLHDH